MRPAKDRGRWRPGKMYLLPLVLLLTTAACATSAAEYCAFGRRDLAATHLAAASRSYHRCIAEDPTRGDAYLALGKIYLREEKWSTAANAFRQAAHLDPSLAGAAHPLLVDALYKDALYEIRLGKRREAIVSFAALYAHAPDYPGLRETYTVVLLRYGRDAILRDDYITGVSALKEVLRLDPTNETARTLLDRTRFAAD